MDTDLIEELRKVLPDGFGVDGYVDRGGQGAVFLGTFNGERVALKLFAQGYDERRLERELTLLATIDCPNLVKVRARIQVTIAGIKTALVAYEFLPGGDLRQLVGTMPRADRIIDIGAQIAAAVEALWERRIVHRDIKPANIVQADQNRYVIVDVGFARHLDRSTITAFGQAPGTPGYASPEQARGRKNLTIHSDIFSLGVTLYEVAAGRHPFNRSQALIGTTIPRPLSDIRGDLPGALSRLIHEMISTVPSDRPRNLRFRLDRLRGG